jgi:hypothetical protein
LPAHRDHAPGRHAHRDQPDRFLRRVRPGVRVRPRRGGANGPPIEVSDSERGQFATPGLASSGAALVAWKDTPLTPEFNDEDTTIRAAARDAGGPFQRLGVIATPGRSNVENVATGVDDVGNGIVVWTQATSDPDFVTRVMYVTRVPGRRSRPRASWSVRRARVP